jgi:hypothetical protein
MMYTAQEEESLVMVTVSPQIRIAPQAGTVQATAAQHWKVWMLALVARWHTLCTCARNGCLHSSGRGRNMTV